MLDDEMSSRFESALRSHDLRALVEQMRVQSLSQAAIYDLFMSFMLAMREQGRQAEEDAVADAMDFIWGGCPREQMWFDRSLNDQEMKAYRKAKGELDQEPDNKSE